MRLADLTGQKFGRLVVVARSDDRVTRRGNRKVQWLCRCDCGTQSVVVASVLVNGHTKSCGCLRRETMARVAAGYNGKEIISYNTAHRRVFATRGSARLLDCTDCGGKATDWAYDYQDQGQLTQETVVNGVVLHRLTYSADPSRYVPKCRTCNIKDRQTQTKEKDE